MDETRKTIRRGLLLLAMGLFLAGIYYVISGRPDAELPAILYLLGGLICFGLERLFTLV